MIRKALAVTALCVLPCAAYAQGMNGYFEGNIGAAFISDVEARVDHPDLTATAKGDYGTELLFGLEGGVSGLGNASNVRLGLSWDRVAAKLNSVNVSGTDISGPFSFNGNCPDPGGFCSEANETVNVIAANAYVDLAVGNQMGIQPFIGVGAGWAIFDDADSQFALSGTLGARVPLSMNAYVGGRYRFQWISGTSDALADYDDIKVHGVSAIIGVNF
jgi:hypothetical protein